MCFFFFNDTATTEIYTLSLHDALPISHDQATTGDHGSSQGRRLYPMVSPPGRASRSAPKTVAKTRPSCSWRTVRAPGSSRDRKSTRLNSSHANISYAVFCLKKKKV